MTAHTHDHSAPGHTHDTHGAHGEHEHHIVSTKTYFLVFVGLMVLLVLTLGVAMIDLGGAWNLLIAMTVAVIKVFLIMTYFMHLKWNTPLVRFFALCALFFLLIMFAFTLSDYTSREWINQ